MRGIGFALLLQLVVVGAASAQHEHARSPYADQKLSEIRSLTVVELEQLRTGEGMGFARAAELNHYPGPRHVLDLADALTLSAEQHAGVTEIFESMQKEARRIGAEIIEAERNLGLRFEHQHIDSTALRSATERLGALYGELRYVHLAAHLATTRLLDAHQVADYDRLRGYAGSGEERGSGRREDREGREHVGGR